MIEFKNSITDNGNCPIESIFIRTFGIMPNKYGKVNSDNMYVVLNKVDVEVLKEKYPGSIIRRVDAKRDPIRTSSLDMNNEEAEYDAIDVYILGQRVLPHFIIFDENNKIFYKFDNDSMMLYYTDHTVEEVELLQKELFDILPKEKIKEYKPSSVKLVAMNDGDYYTIDSKIANVTVDIDKNYNDDFKAIYNDITKFISDNERKSGLIVLNGIPGTGKSMFIRHIINNFTGNYILVTPGIAANMASPEFVSFLMEHMNSVFILEDCENVIMDRDTNSFANAVSSLLNMSDGIMSDVFNAKFICTFNADINKIDKAILRKGRCYANYEFKKLSAHKVKTLLNEKGIELDKYEDMTLADIYHYEDNYKDLSRVQSKIGFGK